MLIVRLDEIGDVILTTPFFRELRRNLPDAWITLVVKPEVYNLVEICPYVNEVLTFNPKFTGPLPIVRRNWRLFWFALHHLWRRRFDLAILPRWDTDFYHATYLLYFSGAPWRVGYSEKVNEGKKHRNKGYDYLLTCQLSNGRSKHEVEHNLNVIRYLRGLIRDQKTELWINAKDEEFAKRILDENGIASNDLLICLAPGAGAPKRVWPANRFLELGKTLHEEYKAKFLIVGSAREKELGKKLEHLLSPFALNMVGQTTLRQLTALLKCCRLYIGNDTGPMHIAGAVNVPIIGLSCHPKSGSSLSPNSPKRFGPWKVKHVIIQPEKPLAPCTKECIANEPHCIKAVTVEEVKRAVEMMLPKSKALEYRASYS